MWRWGTANVWVVLGVREGEEERIGDNVTLPQPEIQVLEIPPPHLPNTTICFGGWNARDGGVGGDCKICHTETSAEKSG